MILLLHNVLVGTIKVNGRVQHCSSLAHSLPSTHFDAVGIHVSCEQSRLHERMNRLYICANLPTTFLQHEAGIRGQINTEFEPNCNTSQGSFKKQALQTAVPNAYALLSAMRNITTMHVHLSE